MAEFTPQVPKPDESVPFWRDLRVLGVLAQIAAIIAVVLGAAWLLNNVAANLVTLGESQFICQDGSSSFRCAFNFLRLDAQFDISETSIAYDPSDSYSRALLVGALNTIKVSFFGIILATVLGTVTGIARLSSNWLVSSVARWYVDIIRNTPLLLQLFFLFFGVILLLPPIREAIQPFGLPVYLSQRGFEMPGPVMMPSFRTWLFFILAGVVLAAVFSWLLGRIQQHQSGSVHRWLWPVLLFVAVAVGGWFFAMRSAADNQGLLATPESGIATFDDIAATVQARLGVDELRDLDELEASGVLTEDEILAAALSVCAVRDDPAEVNLTAQLRRANIPYTVSRNTTLDKTAADFTGGDCDVFVASQAELADIQSAQPELATGTLVPLAETPVRISVPRIEGLNFVGGIKMTPNFAAILIGLSVYTGAFIAEIVRAGIQSVSKGQTEAARALGLSESQRLWLIILPQALRVIIPPLTSQYLNLVKNSSLAIAVGYPDLWSTAFTTLNQSGRPIQVFLIVMGTYLSFSLLISAFLNWYNQRIAFVER
ncbi:MAG: ABC transporter permease subunit [Chloroflexota bacterium]